MAKANSKAKIPKSGSEVQKNLKKPKKPRSDRSKSPKSPKSLKSFLGRVRVFLRNTRIKIKKTRSRHFHPHKSFRRSYREDYLRTTKSPGIMEQIMATFRMIFRHFKTFLPFILLMVVSYIILVGLMSEDFYKEYQDAINEADATEGAAKIGVFARAALLLSSTVTTLGLDSGTDEVGRSFMFILFLVMWLVTIYLVRHFMAGHKLKLRDALYNALTPLISTLIVLTVVMIQAIPLMLVLITYSAAVATGFLATPFYALVYFIFAFTMLLISAYCFSSSLIALAAVTAPGVYPFAALSSASDLMMGRRIHFTARLIALLLTVVFIYIIVMMPVILIDLWLKNCFDWLVNVPIVPFMLLTCTCFVFIYIAAFIYQYYRTLLDYQEK